LDIKELTRALACEGNNVEFGLEFGLVEMEASSALSNNNIFEISTFRSIANHVFVTPESGIFDFIAISLSPIDVDDD
jgi:hypothetical protein